MMQKEKRNIVLNKELQDQLVSIRDLMLKKELWDSIPNILLCSGNEDEIFEFSLQYLSLMKESQVFGRNPFLEKIKYPYQRENQSRFFDSLVFSALNHKQNTYHGLLLVDLSEWKNHMSEPDFKLWLSKLNDYMLTMRVVFWIDSVDVNIDIESLSYHINRELPVIAYNFFLQDENLVEYAKELMEEKRIQFEKQEDIGVLSQILELEGSNKMNHTRVKQVVNRIISVTYQNGHIRSQELHRYMDNIILEQKAGQAKVFGF